MDVMPGPGNSHQPCPLTYRDHLRDPFLIDHAGLPENQQHRLAQFLPLGPCFIRKDRLHDAEHDIEVPSRPESAVTLLQAVRPAAAPLRVTTEIRRRLLAVSKRPWD